MFDCPGCKELHGVRVAQTGEKGPVWDWNGSLARPTLAPSLLLTRTMGEAHTPVVCHSFVRDGWIQFLSDCTHELRGQTVELAPVEP